MAPLSRRALELKLGKPFPDGAVRNALIQAFDEKLMMSNYVEMRDACNAIGICCAPELLGVNEKAFLAMPREAGKVLKTDIVDGMAMLYHAWDSKDLLPCSGDRWFSVMETFLRHVVEWAVDVMALLGHCWQTADVLAPEVTSE